MILRRDLGSEGLEGKKGVSFPEMASLMLPRLQDDRIMKNEPISNSPVRPKPQPSTFGDFVAGVYHTYGKRRAKGIIHFAVATHLVEFRGPERIVFF